MRIKIVDSMTQIITFEVEIGAFSWTCSAVYASPTPVARELLWTHLASLRNTITKPWMVVGDFNEVLLPSEVRGGAFQHSRALLFAAALEHCNMLDLEAKGGLFTGIGRSEEC